MREIHDFLFEKVVEGMTAEEILNYYRNLYHTESQSTERGIVANALNDILPRMFLPPCKVGDKVYVIVVKQPCYACMACTDFCHKDCHFDDKSKMVIKQATVHEICCSNGINKIRVEVEEDKRTCSYDQTFWFEDFGKTVFLARESAEQALKAVSDG